LKKSNEKEINVSHFSNNHIENWFSLKKKKTIPMENVVVLAQTTSNP